MALKPTNANFIELIQSHDKGRLLDAINEELGALVKACFEYEANGELTVKLKLKAGGEGQFEVVPAVAAKQPRRPVRNAIFFGTVDGKLTREDPRQRDFQEQWDGVAGEGRGHARGSKDD